MAPGKNRSLHGGTTTCHSNGATSSPVQMTWKTSASTPSSICTLKTPPPDHHRPPRPRRHRRESTYAYVHARACACAHACMHAHTSACAHSHMHARSTMHTHTHTHANNTHPTSLPSPQPPRFAGPTAGMPTCRTAQPTSVMWSRRTTAPGRARHAPDMCHRATYATAA